MPDDVAVEICELSKSYGHKPVLKGLDLVVPRGEICGILGLNGAGKSTLIKIILDLVRPTSGNVKVLGKPAGDANERVTYLCEDVALYPHLSAIDNLVVVALSSGLPRPGRAQLYTILSRVGLSEVGRKKAQSFSLGMKRRLQLAMATLVKPADLMILDEPTNGLDVEGMVWLKQFLTGLAGQGTSVLLASHALLDIQQVITRYAVLSGGTIVESDRWDPESRPTRYHVGVAGDALASAQRLLVGAGATILQSTPFGIDFLLLASLTRVREVLQSGGVVYADIQSAGSTLEDVFLAASQRSER